MHQNCCCWTSANALQIAAWLNKMVTDVDLDALRKDKMSTLHQNGSAEGQPRKPVFDPVQRKLKDSEANA